MTLRYGNPEEAGMSGARIHRLTELAERWVADGVTPALVLLVARKGVIVFHEAFGMLGPEPDAPPLQRDSIFQLQSLSKPITATLILQLVDDGLLGLNRPVEEYIREFTGPGKDAVMVHHLLTHTSGLDQEDVQAHAETFVGSDRPMYDLRDPRFDASPAYAIDRYFPYIHGVPLRGPPGVEMRYLSYGYQLLGEIVQRITGRSLATVARERVFDPLGMSDTTYGFPTSKRERYVRRAPDAPHADDIRDTECYEKPNGAGNVFSTARDMAEFGQMFLNRGRCGDARVLSRASVGEMTRNQTPGIPGAFLGEYFPESSWGLGWGIHGRKEAVEDGSLYSPSGFSHGGKGVVFLWCDPEYELVGVYFSVVGKLGPGHGVAHARGEWCADLFMNAATAAVVDR
jgi:CubicO group peptidase (beta-lactamase class C family)